MTSNFAQLESDGDDRLLEHLLSDRQAMASRLSSPRWFAPGFGVVAAAFVAIPAIPSDTWAYAAVIAAVATGLSMLIAFRRTTGIKLSCVRARAVLICVGAVSVPLLMLGLLFVLPGSGMTWWITALTVLAYGVVTELVRMFIAATGDHVNHVN